MAKYVKCQGEVDHSPQQEGRLEKGFGFDRYVGELGIWKERNGRVFRNQCSTFNMVLSKIKDEMAMWSLAGAKALSNIMPRE